MNCWLVCNWIMEIEERNWNGIRRTWSRKLLSNKHGKLEKKCFTLRQRLPLYTGEEIQNTFIFMSASDSGQPAIWTGKANTSKTLLPQCSLGLPDQDMMPKIARIIYDAFNWPVPSLWNTPWTDRPTALHRTAPRPPASSLTAAHRSRASSDEYDTPNEQKGGKCGNSNYGFLGPSTRLNLSSPLVTALQPNFREKYRTNLGCGISGM